MARKEIRKCLCCKTEYEHCPSCGSGRLAPSWKTDFCSEECMELWTTATKYNMKMIDKNEAKSKIEALNIQDTNKYVECIQRDLNEIFKEDVVPTVVEEISIPDPEPTIEEKPVEKQFYYKKNKKNK